MLVLGKRPGISKKSRQRERKGDNLKAASDVVAADALDHIKSERRRNDEAKESNKVRIDS